MPGAVVGGSGVRRVGGEEGCRYQLKKVAVEHHSSKHSPSTQSVVSQS